MTLAWIDARWMLNLAVYKSSATHCAGLAVIVLPSFSTTFCCTVTGHFSNQLSSVLSWSLAQSSHPESFLSVCLISSCSLLCLICFSNSCGQCLALSVTVLVHAFCCGGSLHAELNPSHCEASRTHFMERNILKRVQDSWTMSCNVHIL